MRVQGKALFVVSGRTFCIKCYLNWYLEASVLFSHSVVSYSLQPHGPQHTRLPCLSPTPGAYSSSCPSSQWCHPTICLILFCPLLLPSIFPGIRVFSSESVLHIRWPKYWRISFSNSPSNEYSGRISFRIDWFDLSAVLPKKVTKGRNILMDTSIWYIIWYMVYQ